MFIRKSFSLQLKRAVIWLAKMARWWWIHNPTGQRLIGASDVKWLMCSLVWLGILFFLILSLVFLVLWMKTVQPLYYFETSSICKPEQLRASSIKSRACSARPAANRGAKVDANLTLRGYDFARFLVEPGWAGPSLRLGPGPSPCRSEPSPEETGRAECSRAEHETEPGGTRPRRL